MRCIYYLPEDNLKELAKLCLSLYQKDQSILLLVEDLEKGNRLSDYLWKIHDFLPHGVEKENFALVQPVLISTQYHSRDAVICFECFEEKLLNIAPPYLICWNKEVLNPNFLRRVQKNGVWTS